MGSFARLLKEGQVWFASNEKPRKEDLERVLQFSDEKGQSCFAREESISVGFGRKEIDQSLPQGGFAFGSTHEWFIRKDYSAPPCGLLSMLAGNALKNFIENLSEAERQAFIKNPKYKLSRFIVWIGKDTWPSPYVLYKALSYKDSSLGKGAKAYSHFLSNCIFIDPPDESLKLWATLSALSSAAVAVVVSDLKNLKIATTKKLSLAAKKGNSLGFFVRDVTELKSSSVAASRWMLTPKPSSTFNPCYQLQLLKSKGKQSLKRSWNIEFDYEAQHEALSLYLLSDLVNKPATEEIRYGSQFENRAQIA